MTPEEFGRYIDEIVSRLEPLGAKAGEFAEYGFTLIARGVVTSAILWLIGLVGVLVAVWMVTDAILLRPHRQEVEDWERAIKIWEKLPEDEKVTTKTHSRTDPYTYLVSTTTTMESTAPKRPDPEDSQIALTMRLIALGIVAIPSLMQLWNLINFELVALNKALQLIGIQ